MARGSACSSEVLEKLERALVESFLSVFGESLVSLVLYGSYARGEPRADSDIDLLVVLDDVGDRYQAHKLLDEVERLLEPSLRDVEGCGLRPILSPIVLSREQASRPRPLYLDLVFDARVLYDRGEFMNKILGSLRERLASLGAERRRIGSKWVVVLKKEFKFGEVVEL